MPREDDYLQAARTLTRLAERAGSVGAELHGLRYTTTVRGGTLQGIVQQAMDASYLNAVRTVEACRSAMQEMHRRARLAAEYTADIRAWEQSVDRWNGDRGRWLAQLDTDPSTGGPGNRPGRPLPPERGIEAG